jgi:uncharacterized membrane protein
VPLSYGPIKGGITIHSAGTAEVRNWRKWLFHESFRAGITLKGVDGLLEVAGGIILWFVHASALNHVARIFLQHDLPFDRHEFLTNHLFQATEHLATARHFVSIYLVLHGMIKAVLVIALWFDVLWAYPLTIAVFSVFSGYQLYRFSHTHSPALVVITVFDVLIIYLTWREYCDRRISRRDSSQPDGL